MESDPEGILNIAHTKGVQKMEALVNVCVEEEGLDEEAKLSDGKNDYFAVDFTSYEDIVRYSLYRLCRAI